MIAEIETDKATMEVEAVDEGKIGKIVVPEGTENVKVNAVIAVLLTEGESAPAAAPKVDAPKADAPKAEAAKAPAGVLMRENTATQVTTGSARHSAGAVGRTGAGRGACRQPTGARVFASPLAKRLAKEANIEHSAITGSGPHGRVVKSDVEAAKSGKVPLKAAAAAAPAVGGAAPTGMSKAQVMALYPEGSYELVPNDGMRKVVAARLTESKQTVPHFYLTLDCRIDALMEAREKINAAAPLKDGKPSYKLSRQ